MIHTLVGAEHIYAFGDKTPGRKHLKRGDWVCFYANGKGVVAHARVASAPQLSPHRRVRHPDKYPWTFRLDKTALYLDKPVVVDAAMRAKLEVFRERDQEKSWAWFVQATHKVTEHDFALLTRSATSEKP